MKIKNIVHKRSVKNTILSKLLLVLYSVDGQKAPKVYFTYSNQPIPQVITNTQQHKTIRPDINYIKRKAAGFITNVPNNNNSMLVEDSNALSHKLEEKKSNNVKRKGISLVSKKKDISNITKQLPERETVKSNITTSSLVTENQDKSFNKSAFNLFDKVSGKDALRSVIRFSDETELSTAKKRGFSTIMPKDTMLTIQKKDISNIAKQLPEQETVKSNITTSFLVTENQDKSFNKSAFNLLDKVSGKDALRSVIRFSDETELSTAKKRVFSALMPKDTIK